jgi:hypothetical protein
MFDTDPAARWARECPRRGSFTPIVTVLRRYFLGATLLLGGLLCGSLTGLALARAAARHAIGVLPPANPKSDCRGWGVAGIDRCRAREGVAKLTLPSNFSALKPDAQLLVLIDLERVNRGLAPIAVLVRPLNALAEQGARREDDPQFPSCRCFSGGGAIWATVDPPSVFEADELWMYDDAGSGWGHRDNILLAGADLVGGAGATRGNWDFEMLTGYRYSAASVTFRWSQELRYFRRRPTLDPRG